MGAVLPRWVEEQLQRVKSKSRMKSLAISGRSLCISGFIVGTPSAEFTPYVVLSIFFPGIIEDLVRIAVFDKVPRATPCRCIDIEKGCFVRDALRLLQVMGHDGDGVAPFKLFHEIFDVARRDWIQCRAGFIHEENFRFGCDCSCDA